MPPITESQRKEYKINMEKTLSIIKPDGVASGLIGEVIRRLEVKDINIIGVYLNQDIVLEISLTLVIKIHLVLDLIIIILLVLDYGLGL